MEKNILLNMLSKEELDLFKIINYKKNDIIYNEGDICNNVAFIIKGEISITTYTLLEKEFDIKILKEGDTFGEFLAFSTNPFFLGMVIARKEASIAFISKENLYLLLKNNHSFFLKYLNSLSDNTLKLQNRIKVLSQKSIREKILFYIKNEIKKNNSKKIFIKSKEELAKIINIPRPSLSRELIALKNEQIIDFNKHFIIYLK